MTVAVFGMGKIGLPLAVQFARKGREVIGIDTNQAVVDQVNHGTEPFPGENSLNEFLQEVVGVGSLTSTTNASAAVAASDTIVVAVPLYVDSEARPDFSAIDDVTNVIGGAIQAGTLVSLETTLPVGTTRQRIGKRISELSGLTVGKDWHLVFSPERVLTGRVFADLRKYPKLVGGVSPVCEAVGAAFYRSVLDFDAREDLPKANGVWTLGSSEAAELAKLAETTYRDVNIALANQFALYAQKSGLDIYRVIEACNSQSYSHIHSPGVAVGGHCIPVYPRLYLWGDQDASVVRTAREANSEMPSAVVQLASQSAGGLTGKRVLILGAAYRGGVKESAFSGVFPLRDALEGSGAQVFVHDPLYSDQELKNLGLEPFDETFTADVAIVQADHSEYREWIFPWAPASSLLVDGRGFWTGESWPDLRFVTLGRA